VRATGFGQLDHLLGGFMRVVPAGWPSGVGKTTWRLQLTAAATKEVPVVVVTSSMARRISAEAALRPRRRQPV